LFAAPEDIHLGDSGEAGFEERLHDRMNLSGRTMAWIMVSIGVVGNLEMSF